MPSDTTGSSPTRWTNVLPAGPLVLVDSEGAAAAMAQKTSCLRRLVGPVEITHLRRGRERRGLTFASVGTAEVGCLLGRTDRVSSAARWRGKRKKPTSIRCESGATRENSARANTNAPPVLDPMQLLGADSTQGRASFSRRSPTGPSWPTIYEASRLLPTRANVDALRLPVLDGDLWRGGVGVE